MKSHFKKPVIWGTLLTIIFASTITIKGEINPTVSQDIYQTEIDHQQCFFQLDANRLYYLDSTQKKGTDRQLILDKLLDVVIYDLDLDGQDELIVLTLNEEKETDSSYCKGHLQYGDALMIYEMTMEQEKPKLQLKYTSEMKSMHPWMIDAGRMKGSKAEGTLFIGVYKRTKFYKEIINRPFFISWNGKFFVRKWTGSNLSPYEYRDILLVDIDHDGYDEVAALEKKEDGSYVVSIYKWLTFSFEYLMSSKESYIGAESISLDKDEEKPVIWVKDQKGYEKVVFTE